MDVGIYIDGFNLYYGGRSYFGPSSGWRWLDLRALATTIVATVAQQPAWTGANLTRVVYCTARTGDPDQDAYLSALRAHGSYDTVEWGSFRERLIHRPLASQPKGAPRPQVVNPAIPIRVKDGGANVGTAIFMASVSHREEKGSDVNVGTHLLLDVLGNQIAGAIVVTNDSDLKLPLREARQRIPVGLLNPGNPHKRPTAGALRDNPNAGVGGHWWGHITRPQYRGHQLPDPVTDPTSGTLYTKPVNW